MTDSHAAAATSAATKGDGKDWYGHPRPLARLFTTEMWERFGYYGMRALLVLFLTDHFLLSDHKAGGLYGAFTSLVYLTPLFGGLLADRYLGSKRAVKFGAIMMALGYLGLCFNGPAAKPYFEYGGQRYEVVVEKNGEATRQYILVDNQRLIVKGNEDGSISLPTSDGTVLPNQIAKDAYKTDGERNNFYLMITLLSLSAIIVGNGFFKPNISTIVGTLYKADDPRRDSGFTIFYMGINLGSIISQFFCPLLAVWFGWWAGFGLAAVGMLVAWALFQFDGGKLDGYGETPAATTPRHIWTIVLASLAFVPIAWFLLNNTLDHAAAASEAAATSAGFVGYIMSLPMLGKIMFAMFFVALFGVPLWAFLNGTRQEFHMMVVAVVLTFFSTMFWTLFEQAGSSMTLFAERNTDRDILGVYTMPAGQAQIFNPLFVVLLAPVFSLLWVKLAKRDLDPPVPVKFAAALMMVGFGFLVLVFGGQFAGPDARVPLVWLAMAYLIHTIGELWISPVGLSMISKLSMARVVGLMMGTWFLASAMAQYIGGIVAQFASVETVGGEVTNPALSLASYLGVFQTIGLAAIATGLLLLILSPWLKNWMHGVR